MVFPTFFNISLNLAIRSSWSEPQSALGLVFANCIELLHLRLQKYYHSDFGADHLVMSMCRVIFCVVGRGCLLWPVNSLGKTLLAFALLHFQLQGQTCLLLQVSLDFLLCIPIFYDEKDIFFLIWVIEVLVSLHRTGQLKLLWHQWLGNRLGLLWCWQVYLGKEPKSFCHFWACTCWGSVQFPSQQLQFESKSWHQICQGSV